MNNGQPRPCRGFIVCHENGAPYHESFRGTAKEAKTAFCRYWASLGPNEEPRQWRHFEGQGFNVQALVGTLMEG